MRSSVSHSSGVEQISQAFQQARQQGRAALMPYYTLGYPTQADSLAVIEALAGAGADLIELGIPFSDPLADGPTIQHSTQVALQQGMGVSTCLEMVRALRQRGVLTPMLLMGYINPLLSYGIDRFVTDAARCSVDGLILPDLPVEEAVGVEAACRHAGLALVYLIAPTTPTGRIQFISDHSSGFLYLVSVSGVTGARCSLSSTLPQFFTRIRQYTTLPLALGFGISTPRQARQVGNFADGVIIGSALIDAVSTSANPPLAASSFLQPFIDVAHSSSRHKHRLGD